MASLKHTPGPWFPHPTEDYVHADPAVAAGEDRDMAAGYRGPLICETVKGPNQILIAAAPDLLRACMLTIEEDSGLTCRDEIKRAITKATGLEFDKHHMLVDGDAPVDWAQRAAFNTDHVVMSREKLGALAKSIAGLTSNHGLRDRLKLLKLAIECGGPQHIEPAFRLYMEQLDPALDGLDRAADDASVTDSITIPF